MEIERAKPTQLFLVFDNGKTIHFNITTLVSMETTKEMLLSGKVVECLDISLQHDGIKHYENSSIHKLKDEN